MSISPTDAQRSTASESHIISQDPSFDHGVLQPSEPLQPPMSVSTDTQVSGTMPIGASESTVDLYSEAAGQLAETAADSGGFSKKVTESRRPNSKKISYCRKDGTSSHSHLTGRGGIFSESTCDQAGSDERDASGSISQPISGSVNFHGSATHSAARRSQTVNGNHLLKFHYDPISRPQQKMPPPRRQPKLKPYNKDLFLQANYKFVVLDSGNFAIELMDPDKMLQWEDVICVSYSTPYPVQCPICLETPLCPQITSCGHIFCFPCILRYLLMGEEDHKGESWKKCPLCFMMICSKDLYTIYIENVQQHHVGDCIQFTLLTRQKKSLTPTQKNQQGVKGMLCESDELCNSFSKFTLTSDVELSVREAKLELDSWLARAESGVVDDLEKLPYVCAAREQLELRNKCWTEHRACSSSPPLRNNAALYSNDKACKYTSNKTNSHVISPPANPPMANSDACRPAFAVPHVNFKDDLRSAVVPEPFEGQERVLSSSYDERKSAHRLLNDPSDGSIDVKEDSYTFYQANDGQHLILHPLNMKCLLYYYGNNDLLPQRISGKILQLETVTQSEAMRRRYRFLSHFSLTTTFQLCEIDLSDMLPLDALSPFIDEIKKREKERKRLAKKEHKEKFKVEAAAHGVFFPSKFEQPYSDTMFSIDDFEALGASSNTSSTPVGERKLFSNVTRLGFAAGHDSPSLKIEKSPDASSNMEVTNDPSGLTVSSGPRNTVASFANIISTSKSTGNPEVNKNGFGKKGKKPSRVLLSTAGGRRY